MLVPGDQTFAFGVYFLPIIILPKNLAPKTSLQGPLWPSSKIFWLKHFERKFLLLFSSQLC